MMVFAKKKWGQNFLVDNNLLNKIVKTVNIDSDENILEIGPGQGALRRLVLGQQYITIDQAVNTLLKWKGMKQTPRLPLWGWLIEILIKILPIKITDWEPMECL